MGEEWKEETVSLDKVDTEEFDSEISHVTVSERGLRVEFKDVEDWKKIRREVGEHKILEKASWEEIEGLGKKDEHLYYPHIDLELSGNGEKRVYFTEDEEELMRECLNAVRRMWNAYRQKTSRGSTGYDYGKEGSKKEEQREEVELDEAGSGEEAGEEPGEDGSVEDVVEKFIED